MVRLWEYSWKSSDGTRHEDSIEAPSREDAFSLLRQQGIRPIKVTQIIRPIDRILTFSKRFGVLLFVALIVAFVSFFVGRKSDAIIPTNVQSAESSELIATPLPRQQIDISKKDIDSLFKFKSEVYLTRFVSPGVLPPKNESLPNDIVDALEFPLIISDSDDADAQTLKRVISGIKNEIKHLIDAGKSINQINEWLMIRQQMEYDFRKQLIAGREKDKKAKDQINSMLRSLGLKEIE